MNQNIEIFNDTMKWLQSDSTLSKSTDEMIEKVKVYPEGFHSSRIFKPVISEVHFEENLTLLAAKKYAQMGNKTAILNFANPIEPGGGVLRGANAQEESLCRESNLYPSLCSKKAAEFYNLHKSIMEDNQFNSMFLGTDTIIYSPNVTVFKEDKEYQPEAVSVSLPIYTEEHFNVDVITCAAPFFSGFEYIVPNGDLMQLFKRRIANIFEVAIDNNIQSLILGAFGCGAFHNPPQIVAKAFSKTLLMERYAVAFENVVFAVKRTDWFCENIEAFQIAFQEWPPTGKYVFSVERNKRRFFE